MRTTKAAGKGRAVDVRCPLADARLQWMRGFVGDRPPRPTITGRGEMPPWDRLPKRSRRQAGRA